MASSLATAAGRFSFSTGKPRLLLRQLVDRPASFRPAGCRSRVEVALVSTSVRHLRHLKYFHPQQDAKILAQSSQPEQD
jgi:hypothetical protein